jgi:hypothetical protein
LETIGKKVIGNDSFLESVASDEWSRYEIIGGINLDNEFQEGWVTRAAVDNRWLLIDEFNRANMNKAFGELFLVCVVRNSLDEVKSNIDKIRKECYKANRDPENIVIAAILYPDVKQFSYANKEKDDRPGRRQLLSGSVDEIGKDLQEIKKIGVNHAILNYNRSSISNSIDDIIDVSKRISAFIR